MKEKPAAEREVIANSILAMDVDVLAVQEVEDINSLQGFVHDSLDDRYPFHVLIEGNDPRLIDVGVLSKLPIGAMTSWRHAVHPDDPAHTVFSRDLLEIEILNNSRTEKLVTIFNTHLKSHFVPFNKDPVLGAEEANRRRRQQAEMAALIIKARTRPDSRYLTRRFAMKKLFCLTVFVVAVGLLVLGCEKAPNPVQAPLTEKNGVSSLAKASVFHDNFDIPIVNELALNPCAGEDILFNGATHVETHTVIDANGGFHTQFTANDHNLSGVGQPSGIKYRRVGATVDHFNASGFPPFNETFTNTFNMIGQ